MGTNLDQFSSSQSGIPDRLNEDNAALSPAGAFGRHKSLCIGLTYAIYGGNVLVAGVPTEVPNQQWTLTASVPSYIYRTDATLTATTSIPASWPGPLAGGSVALWTVPMGASGPSGEPTDHRLAAGIAPATLSDLTAFSSAQLAAALTDETGTAGKVMFSVDPQFLPSASVTPAVNGNMIFEATSNTVITLKFKGSDGVVRSIQLGPLE